MSEFNISSNHPLIPNAREYMFVKKFVSINANDRDMLKYPLSCSFEIELPQDYLNVQTIKLSSWSFPSFYRTFSELRFNITLLFKITSPYNPSIYDDSPTKNDPLLNAIYAGLQANICNLFNATISEGYYTGDQMCTELTNAMNMAVTNYLIYYLQTNNPDLLGEFISNGGYTDFVVNLNQVSQKIWFGNKSCGFQISNNAYNYQCAILEKNTTCQTGRTYPSYANWGLPWFLGFNYCDFDSIEISPYYGDVLDKLSLPQFLYESIESKKYWVQPSQYKSNVFVVESPSTINIETSKLFFIEIAGLNSIDETKPFNISEFTTHTNGTIGAVNSSFAQVPIDRFGTNLQGLNGKQFEYKYFDPPAERIRRLYITLRYHDGTPVIFGNQDFNLTLEFGLLTPHNEKRMSVQIPEAVKYFF